MCPVSLSIPLASLFVFCPSVRAILTSGSSFAVSEAILSVANFCSSSKSTEALIFSVKVTNQSVINRRRKPPTMPHPYPVTLFPKSKPIQPTPETHARNRNPKSRNSTTSRTLQERHEGESRRRGGPLPSDEGTPVNVLRTFTGTPRPESGVDCLIRAILARPRQAEALQAQAADTADCILTQPNNLTGIPNSKPWNAQKLWTPTS